MPRNIELKAPPDTAAMVFLVDPLREGIWPQGGFSSVIEAVRRVLDGNRDRNLEIEEYFVAYGPNGEHLA